MKVLESELSSWGWRGNSKSIVVNGWIDGWEGCLKYANRYHLEFSEWSGSWESSKGKIVESILRNVVSEPWGIAKFQRVHNAWIKTSKNNKWMENNLVRLMTFHSQKVEGSNLNLFSFCELCKLRSDMASSSVAPSGSGMTFRTQDSNDRGIFTEQS